MKKLIVRIGIALVAVFIVALVVVFLSLNTIVKKGVETVGPMITKVDVKLGSADISPFSGSGKLSKLFVGNPEGYKTPSAIQVGDIKVGVQPGSLLSDVIVVNEVNVQNAEITLEGSLTDNNLTKIMNNVSGASSTMPTDKSQATTPAEKKAAKKFIVKDLAIAGTKVNLNLSLLGQSKQMTVTIPAIHLQNIGVAENGVTSAQLVQAIMKPLLTEILMSATTAVTNLGGQLKDMGKDLGKNGVDEVNKATKGITDLFKKK